MLNYLKSNRLTMWFVYYIKGEVMTSYKQKSSLSKKIIVMLILCLTFAGCATRPAKSKKTATISQVGWILSNLDPDINFCPQDHGNIYVSFFIDFHDKNISSSDIDYLNIKSPTGKYWHFHSQEDIESIMKSNNYDIAVNHVHIEDSPNLLPLGEYTFEVVLHNGNRDTEKLNVSAPGSTDTDGNIRVYTEEYKLAANPPEKFISMPKRATISNVSLNEENSQLNVNFSVDDSIIFNVWLYFYSSNNEYVGMTEYLRNFETGELSNVLNNGMDFYIEGSDNIVKLEADDIIFADNKSAMKDISIVRVALSDGRQYNDSSITYDTESISSMKKLSRE